MGQSFLGRRNHGRNDSHLLGQWLNFKLFGITYLVGKISRSNFFFQGPGRLSEASFFYITKGSSIMMILG